MLKLIKSKNNKTRIFFNTFFVISETIFDKGLSLFINILLARYFAPELFGEYASALGYAAFFSTFCDLGVNGTLVRSIRKDPEHEKEHITNSIILKTILVFLSYSLLAISLYFVNYNNNVIFLILLFGVTRIGNEYLRLFMQVFNAHEKFIFSSITRTLFAISFFFVTISVVTLKGTYFHIAWSRIAIILIFIIILSIIVLKKTGLKFSRDTLKNFLPQMAYYGFSAIFGKSDKRINTPIISLIIGTLYGGYFSNAFIFYKSTFFIPGNISRVLVPHLLKESHTKNRKKFQFTYDVYTKFYSVISIFIGITFFLYARDIILLLYGEKYLPSVPILQVLAIAIPPLFSLNRTMLTLLDKQKIRTKAEAVSLIFNVSATIIFVYIFGPEGAAVATVITNMVVNSICGYYLSSHKYIHFKNITPIRIKLIIITVFCGLLYYLILNKLAFYFSFPVITVIYLSLVIILLMNKDDIRILKEILGKK